MIIEDSFEHGHCCCGCGQKTNIYRGKPRKFIPGHNGRLESNKEMLRALGKKGPEHHNWKGGKTINSRGYALTRKQRHCNASPYVPDHILIAEKVLGKRLPPSAVVHHSDGDTLNNTNSNLVICENQGYHLFLHQRKRAFEAGGVHLVRCPLCKTHDIPENLYLRPNGTGMHRECKSKYERVRKKRASHDNN